MRSELILPVITATRQLFERMLGLSVELGQPVTSSDVRFEVSGIIALSGGVQAAVILNLTRATARELISALTGMPTPDCDAEIADGVGELTNMITGAAKAQLEKQDVSISCPTVVIGNGHEVHQVKDYARVIIPCGCDAGAFALEIAYRPQESKVPARGV